MTSRLVCFVLLFAVMAVRAEDQVRSTQEELRRRKIFFGDIDGRHSDEFAEAVRRYQKRKGLSVSGQEDRDTLRSLGLLPRSPNEPPPKELEWPAEPVLKSDTHLDVIASAGELADQTGVAPPVAAAKSDGSEPQSEAPHHILNSASLRSPRLNISAGKPTRSQPARLSFRDTAAIPRQLADFVAKYLRAVSRNRLENELHFYADRVDYFGQQNVDRRIIEQTLRKYYQRWPKRSYSLIGPINYRLAPGHGEIVVTFRENFSLGNRSGRVKGQTDNQLTINAATSDPRIVAIAERRVRR